MDKSSRYVNLYLNAICESNHKCDVCNDNLNYKIFTRSRAKNKKELIIAGDAILAHYFCNRGHYSEIKPVEEWVDIFKGNNL